MGSMNKFFVFLLISLFLVSFVSADSITGLTMPTEVELDKTISATGIYSADSNVDAGVLCSFYFFRASDDIFIVRATDQYTTATGRFTMPNFPITEPTFFRDSNYYLTAECGDASDTSSDFIVLQRESLARMGQQEFDFATSSGTTDTIFIWGVMILILLALLFSGKSILKFAGGK